MARLIDRILRSAPPAVANTFDRENRNGFVGLFETWQGKEPTESIADDFLSYVADGYKANGVVFAIILARMSLFSDVEFAYQNRSTRKLFGNASLAILETPWPNGTTGELLARMEQDVSLSGNAYVYQPVPGQLQRLRPDWVEILTDGAQPIGYLYHPGGRKGPQGGREGAVFITVDEMVHWSPIPDPAATFRGMSWLTPVVREILADKGMTRHKEKFFENAATPNLLVKVQGELSREGRAKLRDALDERYGGAENAYKTLILDEGADASAIGADFQQMSFDAVQAAGENRITAAAGVPGIVVGLKEGLQAATYSNYAQALRRWVDVSMRWQWRSVSVALSKFVTPPTGCRLWYDTSHIAALRNDDKDRATILQSKASALLLLTRAGYDQSAAAQVVDAFGEGLASMPVSTAPLFPAGIPSPSADEVDPEKQQTQAGGDPKPSPPAGTPPATK